MGCSRGVPGLSRAVPGCSGGVPGMFRGVPGLFRGVPGCSGVFRGVPGFYRHPKKNTRRTVVRSRVSGCSGVLQTPKEKHTSNRGP